jgi:hypothetical protein
LVSPRIESISTFSICHAPMSDGAVALLQVSLDDLTVEKPCRTGWNVPCTCNCSVQLAFEIGGSLWYQVVLDMFLTSCVLQWCLDDGDTDNSSQEL